jgi:hypothetical protein
MACDIPPNTTVSGDLQYWRWNYSLNYIVPCGPAYIRPDNGGSLQPWILVVFQIIIHSPAAIVRMARWDHIQILSLALASVMIYIYIQAYVSTGLTPSTVLAWTPLTLILDAGSLLQILVLIVEEITLKRFLCTVAHILSKPWRIRQKTSRRQSDDIRIQQHGKLLSSSQFLKIELIVCCRF